MNLCNSKVIDYFFCLTTSHVCALHLVIFSKLLQLLQLMIYDRYCWQFMLLQQQNFSEAPTRGGAGGGGKLSCRSVKFAYIHRRLPAITTAQSTQTYRYRWIDRYFVQKKNLVWMSRDLQQPDPQPLMSSTSVSAASNQEAAACGLWLLVSSAQNSLWRCWISVTELSSCAAGLVLLTSAWRKLRMAEESICSMVIGATMEQWFHQKWLRYNLTFLFFRCGNITVHVCTNQALFHAYLATALE